MTDKFETFKTKYTANRRIGIGDVFANDEHFVDYLLKETRDTLPEVYYNYTCSMKLSKEDWDEWKRVFDLYDSPLMKALT